MKKILLVLYLIKFLALTDTISQETVRQLIEQDKNSFESILNEETGQTKTSDNTLHKYYLIPDELPEWFLEPSHYASSSDYMIGISDPGMDSSKAMQSAVLRAKSLYLLSRKTDLENISDNFEVTRESSKKMDQKSQFLDFTRVTSGSDLSGLDFRVDQYYHTKYGEMLVLLAIQSNPADHPDTLAVTGELMQLAREDEILLQNTVFCRLDIQYTRHDDDSADAKQMSYIFKSQNDRYDIISLFNQDTIPFPVHPYRYISAGETTDSLDSVPGFYTGTGLWNAYINLILSKLNYHNKLLKSSVKTTFDNYSLKNQGIVRTVSRNKLSFSLEKLRMQNQQLDVKLQFQNE